MFGLINDARIISTAWGILRVQLTINVPDIEWLSSHIYWRSDGDL